MSAALALLIASSGPIATRFPILAEVRAGAEEAQARWSLKRTFEIESSPIGFWSDGFKLKAVERVIWFSDRLLSRWLGYLQVAEQWPEGELERRAGMIREGQCDREWFLIVLRAYPRSETFELGDRTPAKTENLTLSQASLIRNKIVYPISINRLAAWETRELAEMDQFRWWLDLPFGGPLTPIQERDPIDHPVALGDYYGAWYLGSVPRSVAQRPFQIRMQSPTKRREARFEVVRYGYRGRPKPSY